MVNPIFNDIFDGNLNDNNTTTGTNLDDVIVGDNGNDLLRGLSGNDFLFGNNGNDSVYGEAGNDQIDGGEGHDLLGGGAGNDSISGGTGYDRVYEIGNLNYVLTDVQLTGNGTDLLQSIEAASLTGGGSNNIIDATAFNGATVLRGLNGDDLIRGGSREDRIDGGNDNDRLYGYDGDDLIRGEAGNDYLWGGEDYDLLEGGAGNDELIGGNGNDTLVGGLGNDTLSSSSIEDSDIFRFDAIADRRDTILDFDAVDGAVPGDDRDIIQISNAGFNATGVGVTDLPNGTLSADRFVSYGASLGSRAGFRYFEHNGELYFDSNGGGISGSELLVTLTNTPSFSSLSDRVQVV
ncbi:MAG: calcium-binding protein [Elainellaceae cyanobacterium]